MERVTISTFFSVYVSIKGINPLIGLKEDVQKIRTFADENGISQLSLAEKLLYEISKFRNGYDGFTNFVKLFEGKLLFREEIQQIEDILDNIKKAIEGKLKKNN